MDDVQEKPRRHRRTKAEMEAARRGEESPDLEPTVIPIEASEEPTQETKTRKKRTKKNSGDGLYTTLEGLRQALQMATGAEVKTDSTGRQYMDGGSIYVPTAQESPYILKPIAGLISRHYDVPDTDNPDLSDIVTLAVGIFGMYRMRVMVQAKEKAVEKQRQRAEQYANVIPMPQQTNQPTENAQEQTPFPFTPSGEGESMAEFAARQQSQFSQPVAAPYMG